MPKETFQLTHQRLLLVLLLVVLFLFAACSSAPSASEGKKFLDDTGAKLNLFRVKSFTKTNGISDERTYTMEYEAELECLDTRNILHPGVFNIDCQTKGQIVKIQGRIVFEKTENGWRAKL